MPAENDWRLMRQERYLQAVELFLRTYASVKGADDHDHCAFCFAKFANFEGAGILHEGYTTKDSYHWVCVPCFDDFVDLFGWQVAPKV